MSTKVPSSKTESVPGILYGREHWRFNVGTGEYLRRVSETERNNFFLKYEACLRFQRRHFQRHLYRKVLYVIRNDYRHSKVGPAFGDNPVNFP